MIHLTTQPRIYHCEPDWRWAPPPFTDHDVWIVLGGVGSMRCNGREFPLSAGSSFVFGPGSVVSASHDMQRPLHVFACHFTPITEAMERALDFGQGQTFVHAELPMLQFAAMLAEECASCAFREDDTYVRSLLQTIVLHVLAGCRRASLPAGPARVAQCAEAVRRAPGREWNPEEMARGAGFSLPQFNRHFRALTGESPRQFVIARRMERAMQLLRESDLTIAEIADALGYTDVFFFHRQFRQSTGTTPRTLRLAARG